MSWPRSITAWICPNCGNFYASSNAGNLDEEWNTEKNTNVPTFRRSRCPNPPCAAEDIHRVRVELLVPRVTTAHNRD